jgi:integrase
MNNHFNFTKTAIKALPIPKAGKDYYKDTKEKGLSLYITFTGHVTFFIRKRVNGKDERIILGNFPETEVEQAREKALRARAQVSEGKHPNEEKNKLRSDITFGEMFEQFMERYSKKHKRSWRYDEREVNKFLSHLFKRKASSLSKQEIQLLHEKIREENGLYQANRLLERIRAIYNKSIEWEWFGTNPTLGIKKFKEKSRDRFIQPDELPRFFQALKEEGNSTVRDYIWISLLTGARKANVLSMRWNEINLSRKGWRIPVTKNDEPLTIPLTEEAIEVLLNREKEKINEFVFLSEKSSKGFVQDPKKAWQRILKKATIKDLRIHDLRRTLGSYQVATGSSLPIIGKSLGHKSSKATEVYARLNLDPIRESVKKPLLLCCLLLISKRISIS